MTMDVFEVDGTGNPGNRREVAPSVLRARRERAAVYGRVSEQAPEPDGPLDPLSLEDRVEDEVMPPPPVRPRDEAVLSQILTPPAFAWARKNASDASKLLEWAASTHGPKFLTVKMDRVSIVVSYVKLERAAMCYTFFLGAGAPAIGIDFGTEVTLLFEGRELQALTAATGSEGSTQFPYARLEFFEEVK